MRSVRRIAKSFGFFSLLISSSAFCQQNERPVEMVELNLVCEGSVRDQINNYDPKYDTQFTVNVRYSPEISIMFLKVNYLTEEFQFVNFELDDENFLQQELSETRFYIEKFRSIRVDWLENNYPDQVHGTQTQKIDINRISGRANFEIRNYSELMGLDTTTRGSGTCRLAPAAAF